MADAARVMAALSAYRAAMREVAGTADAAINGMYERATMHQIAVALRVADSTAAELVHTADALERRFPKSWVRFAAGQLPWRGMQIIHAQAVGLDPERVAEYDQQAAAALDTTPLPRLKERLHRIRERLQADTAVRRHRDAMANRSVVLDPAPDGMATVTILGDAPEMIGFDHQLSQAAIHLAGLEHETRTVTQLRYDLLMDLLIEGAKQDADPGDERLTAPMRKGVEPEVSVLVPAMSLLGASDVPATLAGYGPIDLETAKRLAGTSKTWIRVLTHPVDGTILDIDRNRYRPPEDLRRLVTTLDGTCRCGCGRRNGDLDHVKEWVIHRGTTALNNLILLARRCHRIKTSGPYSIELLPDRTVAWTSIWGTRVLIPPEADPEPTPVPDQYLSSANDHDPDDSADEDGADDSADEDGADDDGADEHGADAPF